MKLKDLLDVDPKDCKVGKQRSVLRHSLRKRKNNPIASKTTKLANWNDIFGGMAGYGSDENNVVGPEGDL